MLVQAYSGQIGFEIGAHALRATAATNALRPSGRHRQGAGVARPRQHRHDTDLLAPTENRVIGAGGVGGSAVHIAPAAVEGKAVGADNRRTKARAGGRRNASC